MEPDLIAELDEPTPEQERIRAVLADLDQVIALHQRAWYAGAREDLYCATCGTASEYPVAWPCETHQIAARIRRTLTGEDTDHD